MRIYIGNLHWKTDEAKLERMFAQLKVTLMSSCITRDADGISKQYGFIVVDDVHAEQALKANSVYLDGNKLKVQQAGRKFDDGKPKPKRAPAVTSGNLFD